MAAATTILAGASPAAAAERLATFHRSEQGATVSCERLWSVLQQRGKWLSQMTSETLLAGVAGQAGEVTRVVTTFDGVDVVRIEKTLLAEPGRRRIVAMEPVGVDLLGFVDHRLTPQGRGCRIELSLSLTHVPPPGVDGYAATFSKGTQDKIDADLKTLVRAAEQP